MAVTVYFEYELGTGLSPSEVIKTTGLINLSICLLNKSKSVIESFVWLPFLIHIILFAFLT